MAFLFAILLGIGRTLAMEHEHACIDALVTSPVPRESIYLGKVLSNLAFVGVAQLLMLPLAIVLLQLDPAGGVLLLVTVVLATVALVAVATLLSHDGGQHPHPRGDPAGARDPGGDPGADRRRPGHRIALTGGGVGAATSWLLLLTAAAALFLLLGLATFRHVLEE
jgi:ABC-type Na+ efflux pump permease subunit